VRFVAEHADRVTVDGLRWGVEPICRVLTEHGTPIAPSTFYDARGRTPSRTARDEQLKTDIVRVHQANFGVYGARKVWLALNREGTPVARCTVERLMRELGLEGARRGKRHRTTIADPGAPRPADLVERRFSQARPDAVWVADFTYVATWSGTVYVAFVLDAHSRRILGWRAATTMRTELVLDALEQAIWTRAREGVDDLSGLVCHNDAGSQGEVNRSSQHLKITEVCDGTTSAAGGSGPSAGDALAGSADAGAAHRARLLAPDRAGQAHRGRRARSRRVDPGRVAMVSPRWRHAAAEPGRAHRSVSVVPRA
jgi:putative transposase